MKLQEIIEKMVANGETRFYVKIKNDSKKYFSINTTLKIVTEFSMEDNSPIIGIYTLDEFEFIEDNITNDYEYYNPVQIINCGYLALSIGNNSPVDVANKIYDQVERDDKFDLCGLTNLVAGNISNFSFVVKHLETEVHICTIDELIHINNDRKNKRINAIPYIKFINKDDKCLFVYFAQYDSNYEMKDTAKKRTHLALDEVFDLGQESIYGFKKCNFTQTVYL